MTLTRCPYFKACSCFFAKIPFPAPPGNRAPRSIWPVLLGFTPFQMLPLGHQSSFGGKGGVRLGTFLNGDIRWKSSIFFNFLSIFCTEHERTTTSNVEIYSRITHPQRLADRRQGQTSESCSEADRWEISVGLSRFWECWRLQIARFLSLDWGKNNLHTCTPFTHFVLGYFSLCVECNTGSPQAAP